ncbi:MAG: hypothetical protein AB2L24_31760 [Mangrovibacterium sp.]
MKKVLIITLALSIISIVFMILFFLASTDIYHEYIGTTIISKDIISNIEKLPEWTTCQNEWRILKIDYIIRFILMILLTLVLIKMISNYNEKSSNS